MDRIREKQIFTGIGRIDRGGKKDEIIWEEYGHKSYGSMSDRDHSDSRDRWLYIFCTGREKRESIS
jgi:hypothetical protein